MPADPSHPDPRGRSTDAERLAAPGYRGTIIKDPSDTRDLVYRPALGLLRDRFLCSAMLPGNSAYRQNLAIRDQGAEPRCIGEALAAVVDIQRVETYRNNGDLAGAQRNVLPASGAMLYAMALEIEGIDQGRRAQDIYSLRCGLKGFYNTGVCTERTWNDRPLTALGDNVESASVHAMREARNVTLGAYYRVHPYINDYHAALIEAGALYVSAELHDGWDAPRDGVVLPSGSQGRRGGGHAFVIVGYDAHGFLVLNSWGPGWGGYAFDGGPSLPGIALWPYADWAGHAIDAWALRLAAPTPEAFRFSIGPKGTAMFGADQAVQSVRRLEVLGHFVHLDDGRHVAKGTYPSSRQSLTTTLTHLETKSTVTDIRLTFNGDVLSTAQVLTQIARGLSDDKGAGVHGLAMLWVNGLLASSADALQPLFDAALAIANGNRDDADRRIEQMTRPVGRALWRDARRAAETAARIAPEGDAMHAVRSVVALCRNTGKHLHIVVEGAGALLFAALLRETPDPGTRGRRAAFVADLCQVLGSVTLVAPLIGPGAFNPTIGRFLELSRANFGQRATLFRPDAAFDRRLSVGVYTGSWNDLVSRAFEDPPTRLVGAHDFRGVLRGDPDLRRLQAPAQPPGDLSSAAVLRHADVRAHVAATIAAGRAKDRTAPPAPLP